MFLQTLLILAMSFMGEINYKDGKDHSREALLIYDVAKNRADVCGTNVGVELLKTKMQSCQNGKGVQINKNNIHELVLRLKDALMVMTSDIHNTKVLYYHAAQLPLENTSQDKKAVVRVKREGDHIFYASNDYSFCRASLSNTIKINKSLDTNIDKISLCVDDSSKTDNIPNYVEPSVINDLSYSNRNAYVKFSDTQSGTIIDKKKRKEITIEELREELERRLNK